MLTAPRVGRAEAAEGGGHAATAGAGERQEESEEV